MRQGGQDMAMVCRSRRMLRQIRPRRPDPTGSARTQSVTGAAEDQE